MCLNLDFTPYHEILPEYFHNLEKYDYLCRKFTIDKYIFNENENEETDFSLLEGEQVHNGRRL